MTTNLSRIQKLVRTSRLLRPALDCALLATVLGAYAVIQQHTNDSNQDRAAQGRISQLLGKHASQSQRGQTMVLIEQHHESESAMWQGFKSWLEEEPSTSGHCSFSALTTRTETGTGTPYRLQCTANRQPNKPTDPGQRPVFSTVMLAKPAKAGAMPGTSPVNQAVAAKPEKVYPVQGWVDTPSGRKQFDTRNKRWTP